MRIQLNSNIGNKSTQSAIATPLSTFFALLGVSPELDATVGFVVLFLSSMVSPVYCLLFF
jgi:hypothetical protein